MKSLVPDEIIFPHGTESSERNIAENFNRYFVNSIKEIVRSIPDPQYIMENNDVNYVEIKDFQMISLTELRRIILKLKNKIFSDAILDVKMLKNIFMVLEHVILNIINSSLNFEGVVPVKFKSNNNKSYP